MAAMLFSMIVLLTVAVMSVKAGHHWVMDGCQQCRCDDGVMYCSRQTCPDVQCPSGHSLKYRAGACCPQCVKDDAVCTVTTGSRHTTFDGYVFNAPGKCRYHLVRDCAGDSLYVKIRNSPRTTDEFWTELVTVGFANYTVHLYRGMLARVNERKVRLPHVVPPHFAVQHIGNSLVINAYDYHGFKVIWDGQSRLEVTVSKAYKNKLCGLCGNNNGDPGDDMADKLGRHVTSPARFLASWRVLGVCHRQRGPRTADLISACAPGTPGAVRAEKVCGKFLHREFAACSARIDILPYISQEIQLYSVKRLIR
nr:hypothetical protein BaRGS_005318 [Batillaria attramentaria]